MRNNKCATKNDCNKHSNNKIKGECDNYHDENFCVSNTKLIIEVASNNKIKGECDNYNDENFCVSKTKLIIEVASNKRP